MISSALDNLVNYHRLLYSSLEPAIGQLGRLGIQNPCRILGGTIYTVFSVIATSLKYTKQYEWCSLENKLMAMRNSITNKKLKNLWRDQRWLDLDGTKV